MNLFYVFATAGEFSLEPPLLAELLAFFILEDEDASEWKTLLVDTLDALLVSYNYMGGKFLPLGTGLIAVNSFTIFY